MHHLNQRINTTGAYCSDISGDPKEPRFVIVKNADRGHWEAHFQHDPKVLGVREQYSAFFSYYGEAAKLKMSYTDRQQAERALARISELDPGYGYAVCPLREA